jgi:hypothetical protein
MPDFCILRYGAGKGFSSGARLKARILGYDFGILAMAFEPIGFFSNRLGTVQLQIISRE